MNKTATGIGATHLELNSSRNSIIVLPLKSIAYSKKAKNYLYVGSPIGNQKEKVSVKDIQDYILEDYYQEDVFKKILVVADSLPKVMEALMVLKDAAEFPHHHWFLVIDEVDSFQTDSSYRPTIEKCIDYYKHFPPKWRCMLSATLMDFSDPYLETENLTIVKYSDAPQSEITLVHTNNVFDEALQTVKTIIAQSPNQKIVVAYTALDHIRLMAKELEKDNILEGNLIKIMCSESSFEKGEAYYSSISDESLPGKVNFITSAYFTGIDINEQFHLVSVSNATAPYTLLSNHKLKQIAGRGRKGLLSNTVIYSTSSTAGHVFYTKENLIEIAESQIKAVRCFEHHFLKNQYLKELSFNIHKALIEVSNNIGKRVVRENIENSLSISYLNIDGILEDQRVLEIYADKNVLPTLLREDGYTVSYSEKNWRVSERRMYQSILEAKISYRKDAINRLNAIDEDDIQQFYDLKNNPGTSEKQEVYDQYEFLTKYISKESAIELLEEMSTERDNKSWKNLKMALSFLTDNTPFKNDIVANFPYQQIFSAKEVFERLNKVFAYHRIDPNWVSTERNAIRTLNLFFVVVNPRSKNEGGGKKYMVKGQNPKGLQLK